MNKQKKLKTEKEIYKKGNISEDDKRAGFYEAVPRGETMFTGSDRMGLFDSYTKDLMVTYFSPEYSLELRTAMLDLYTYKVHQLLCDAGETPENRPELRIIAEMITKTEVRSHRRAQHFTDEERVSEPMTDTGELAKIISQAVLSRTMSNDPPENVLVSKTAD